MGRKIRISSPEVTMEAVLNQTTSADNIWDSLPCESRAQLWGDEVYFEIPVALPEESAQAVVPSGTIAYWPPGKCFCIFFGRTPYSPVNVLGVLDGDPKAFGAVKSGSTIRLERAEPNE